MDTYEVHLLGEYPQILVTVPGSKSITNRALLMAAMAKGETVLSGILFSDDSRVFLQALQDMGLFVHIEEQDQRVTVKGMGGVIPNKNAKIYVGSAGTAARFLTAFVAMSEGICLLDASDQMKKRPMKELLDALRSLGAKIHCLEEPDTFPMEITGIGYLLKCEEKKDTACKEKGIEEKAIIRLNIDRSSQFLSALLMTAPLQFETLTILLEGKRSARSYVKMTEQMMKQFAHPGVVQLDKDTYEVSGASYQAQEYQVEPDVSAACYFYGMAAITGGTACVRHMRSDSLQGDMKFLNILEQMGCILSWNEGQLVLQGPEIGKLHGVDADLSDFSDQALTLAAIAPYADDVVRVRNVEHIRGQECDRIHAIEMNLNRMNVRCDVKEDEFTIYPSKPQPAMVETFDDHRVAMAFTLTGLRAEGIRISNPSCCRKTFEEYFQVVDKVIFENR